MQPAEIQAICGRYKIQRINHMTHIDNVPSIVKHGLLSKNSMVLHLIRFKERIPYESIAEEKIQKLRTHRKTCDGDQALIIVHDYVPMFFAKHTPMQYVITISAPTKGREAKVCNTELAFILVDPVVAFMKPGTLIADGNVAAGTTKLFSSPERLDSLEWNVIRSRNKYPWCYDPEWRRLKSAEVLVRGGIFFDQFSSIVVYADSVREKMTKLHQENGTMSDQELETLSQKIVVDRSYYMEQYSNIPLLD